MKNWMKKSLASLESSLNSDFKAWYLERLASADAKESNADTLTRLAAEAREAKFSGECSDWLLARAADCTKAA